MANTDVLPDCFICRFLPLCGPCREVLERVSQIRTITIDAWLASSDKATIYNSYDCPDSEAKFDQMRSHVMLHLASGCDFWSPKKDK
jgi:hypothetical protein